MISRRLSSVAALVAATALLSGCLNDDDSSGLAAGSEEEAIQNVILDMNDYADTDVRYYDDGSGAALAPIATERWRREVQHYSRTVEIQIDRPGDAVPTATVEVTGNATGLLHLWAAPGETDPWSEFVKDFDDSGVRSLFFERVRQYSPRHHGWRLQALSGVEIASENTTRRIQSVRIQAGDVDETITGVSELIALEDILRIPAGAEVTVTVDTGDATDSVYLHLRGRFRQHLESAGDGTFTGKFGTDDSRRGPRHLVVDVLSNGTLFDDQEAYDNIAWGYPFAIEGQDTPNDRD